MAFCSSLSSKEYHYFIDSSNFQNITITSNGGGIFISNTVFLVAVVRSSFIRISALSGGGLYLEGKIVSTLSNYYSYCSASVNGGSVFQTSLVGFSNHLNNSHISNSYVAEHSNWCLKGGNCLANYVNTSYSTCPNREATGHYYSGPISNGYRLISYRNNGKGIYGPFCLVSGTYYHEYCSHINNTVGDLGVIIIWDGIHVLRCSLFVLNAGVISSSGTGSWNGKGSLLFDSCLFDRNLVGSYTTSSNCVFNDYNGENFHDYFMPVTCSISFPATFLGQVSIASSFVIKSLLLVFYI